METIQEDQIQGFLEDYKAGDIYSMQVRLDSLINEGHQTIADVLLTYIEPHDEKLFSLYLS